MKHIGHLTVAQRGDQPEWRWTATRANGEVVDERDEGLAELEAAQTATADGTERHAAAMARALFRCETAEVRHLPGVAAWSVYDASIREEMVGGHDPHVLGLPRLRRISLDYAALALGAVFTESKPGTAVRCTKGLPEGAQLLYLFRDWGKMALVCVFAHPSFPESPEGAAGEDLVPEFVYVRTDTARVALEECRAELAALDGKALEPDAEGKARVLGFGELLGRIDFALTNSGL